MKEYTVITYRLKKSVNPDVVLRAIEEILEEQDIFRRDCLFRMSVPIIEFEHEGRFFSNRKNNGILRICKQHPELEAFFEHSAHDMGDGVMGENLCLANFSDDDYRCKGKIPYADICHIVKKIPRPYAVNLLEVVFDSIPFAEGQVGDRIRMPKSGFGPPVGNYILYERSVYGNEKHSYVLFAAEKAIVDDMRELFFRFAQLVPGKYEGTEIKHEV